MTNLVPFPAATAGAAAFTAGAAPGPGLPGLFPLLLEGLCAGLAPPPAGPDEPAPADEEREDPAVTASAPAAAPVPFVAVPELPVPLAFPGDGAAETGAQPAVPAETPAPVRTSQDPPARALPPTLAALFEPVAPEEFIAAPDTGPAAPEAEPRIRSRTAAPVPGAALAFEVKLSPRSARAGGGAAASAPGREAAASAPHATRSMAAGAPAIPASGAAGESGAARSAAGPEAAAPAPPPDTRSLETGAPGMRASAARTSEPRPVQRMEAGGTEPRRDGGAEAPGGAPGWPLHAPASAARTHAPTPSDPAGDPAPARAAEPAAPEAPARAGPVRALAIRLEGAHDSVDVRLSERGGAVHVAVHTADAGLAGALRRNVGEIETRLEARGYPAEPPQARAAPEPRRMDPDSGYPSGSGGQNPQERGGDGRRHGRNGRQHPGQRDGKEFRWIVSSIR